MVHIELVTSEVSLFGSKASVSEASDAIDCLQETCKEAVVSTEGGVISASALQVLGDQCGATLVVVDGGISVLGSNSAVDSTVKELELYITGQKDMPEVLFADNGNSWEYSSPRVAAGQAATAAKRAPAAVQQPRSKSEGGRVPSPPQVPAPERSAHAQAPSIVDAAAAYQSSSHPGHQGHCHEHASCPTCGVRPFCGSCGFMLIPQPMPMMMGAQACSPSGGAGAFVPVAARESAAWQQQQQLQGPRQPLQSQQQQQQQQWHQQQQQQQQMVMVPYTSGTNGIAMSANMAQVWIPLGSMMAVPDGMAAQQCHVGTASDGVAERQACMVPMWTPQQCVSMPCNQSTTLNQNSPKAPSETAYMATSLGSLPPMDCVSSAGSLDVLPVLDLAWQF
jgi:hypothetical protein